MVPTGMMSDVSFDKLSDCIVRESSSSLRMYGASFTGHHLHMQKLFREASA